MYKRLIKWAIIGNQDDATADTPVIFAQWNRKINMKKAKHLDSNNKWINKNEHSTLF